MNINSKLCKFKEFKAVIKIYANITHLVFKRVLIYELLLFVVQCVKVFGLQLNCELIDVISILKSNLILK